MALKFGPALIILVSFVSMLVGVILHSISIDELKFRSPAASHFDPNVIIGDSTEDLVWFLQVTDLHLSIQGHYDRGTDFAEFVDRYVDIINPDVVLVTGDITDGRMANTTFGTGQQIEEWLTYNRAVSRYIGAPDSKKPMFLDIRGNHDNFNIYRPKDPSVPYRQYSVMGREHDRNYMKILQKNNKNYTFIGVDEVQTPGLKILFNFIGIVKDDDLAELKKFKEFSKANNSQYNIWFAHYPTSSIASPHEGLRNIIDGPYLCGHYHTIGNWVMQMHSTQQPGFAEVELGDWKYNRRVRLAAIDHQLFSLVDVGFREFPIALMTNPKPAQFSMPKYEPVDRIKNSTHMRVIAFSNATITKVTVSIDGSSMQNMDNVKGPLYVLKWNPMDYSTGLHTVKILVSDSGGSSRTYTQQFSLDNSKDEFSLGARILLRVYFKSTVMAMFFFIVVVCALPIISLRLVSYRHEETRLKRHYRGTFIFSLQQLSKVRRLFYPIVTIPIWMSIGPHFFGYLVDQAFGVCFVWGILIDGTFIHTGITYNVGSLFLLLVHIPEVILLTYQVSSSYKSISTTNSPTSILSLRLIIHLAITALQMFMGYILYSAYGKVAIMTSFPFTCCIFIYAYCWYQTTRLEKSDFMKINETDNEEQQALTGKKSRDDKSSTSDNSSL